jgi:hypothetical protein
MMEIKEEKKKRKERERSKDPLRWPSLIYSSYNYHPHGDIYCGFAGLRSRIPTASLPGGYASQQRLSEPGPPYLARNCPRILREEAEPEAEEMRVGAKRNGRAVCAARAFQQLHPGQVQCPRKADKWLLLWRLLPQG